MNTSAPDIARRAASRLAVEFGLTRKQRDRVVEVVAEEVVASGAAPEEDTRDAAIDRLYAELRQLMSRPESDPEIEQKLARLRALQQEEASAMRERYIARSPLKPGAGWQALSEARKLLSEKDPLAEHFAALRARPRRCKAPR